MATTPVNNDGLDDGSDELGQRKRPQTSITPLTLWIPLKQDAASQAAAAAAVQPFATGIVLSPSDTTHFFRVITIPNNNSVGLQGIVVATIFDGTDINAYCATLWNWTSTAPGINFQATWTQFCNVMLNPPANPATLAAFQTYTNANLLSKQSDLSYGYVASVQQITTNPNLPIAISPAVNPLSLFVPMMQTGLRGAAGRTALPFVKDRLAGNFIPDGTLIHFALVAIIPNPPGVKHKYSGFLLLTCFDGPMDPYLGFFWTQKAMRLLWGVVCETATNLDPKEVKKNKWITSQEKFKSYINANNRSVVGGLSGAYTASLPDIFRQYPISMPTP
jgi:hypothetical protein